MRHPHREIPKGKRNIKKKKISNSNQNKKKIKKELLFCNESKREER